MFELAGIAVRYDGRAVLAIESLAIPSDRVTVILGPNGSGKSTLMDLLARQKQPTTGYIRYDGRRIASFTTRDYARAIAYLPQHLPDVPGLNVGELCALGRFPWRGALGRWTPDDETIIDAALESVDLLPFKDRTADRLSGGERQRAWIAMLLAQQAPVLMLDEPISALDLAHQIEVLSLLRSLNRSKGHGVLIILHDVNLAARYADRIVALRGGELFFEGEPGVFMDTAILSRLYDVRLDLVKQDGRDVPIAVVA